MGRREELTETFDAESEDGERFQIEVYTTMIDAGTLAEPNAPPLQGRLPTFRTSEGHLCSKNDDGTLEIVKLGLTVRRVAGS